MPKTTKPAGDGVSSGLLKLCGGTLLISRIIKACQALGARIAVGGAR